MYANHLAAWGTFHTNSMMDEMNTAAYMIGLTMNRFPVRSLMMVNPYVDTIATVVKIDG